MMHDDGDDEQKLRKAFHVMWRRCVTIKGTWLGSSAKKFFDEYSPVIVIIILYRRASICKLESCSIFISICFSVSSFQNREKASELNSRFERKKKKKEEEERRESARASTRETRRGARGEEEGRRKKKKGPSPFFKFFLNQIN